MHVSNDDEEDTMSTVHANCTHPKTKSARAACRKAAAKGAPAPVVKPLATEIQTPVTPSHTIQAVTDVTVREIAMSAQIDAYQLEATRAQVETNNARAAKKGLAGPLTKSVEEVAVTETNELKNDRASYRERGCKYK